MSFEDILSNGIPLHEASRFFLGLKKTAAQPTQPPDETGTLEGQFAAPVEQVLAAMGEQVRNEFETHMSYKVYAQTLRDLSHFAIAEHFEEHCADEMDHADFLLRRMAALGGPANIPDVQAPPASADAVDIIQRMIRMEQEAVMNWRNLRQLVGDQNPTAIAVDDYMLKEQEHVDDLWLLLPATARSALTENGMQPQPAAPAVPAAASPAPAQQAPSPPKTAAMNPLQAARHVDPELDDVLWSNAPGYGSQPYQDSAVPYLTDLARNDLEMFHKDMASQADYQRKHPFLGSIKSPEAVGGAALGGIGGAMIGGAISGPSNFGRNLLGGALAGTALGGGIGALAAPNARQLQGRADQYRSAVDALAGDALHQEMGARVQAYNDELKQLAELDRAAASAPQVNVSQHNWNKAAMRMKVAAAMLKQSNEMLESAGTQAPPADVLATSSAGGAPSAEDPNAMGLLAQEQQAQAAQDMNEAAYYKQRFQAAQQMAQQTQQQLQQLQQQMGGMQQQIDQAMQQGQQIQQQAMQNSQAAQAAATQAMQQTLAANSELINQQQLAANMRNAYQQLQQQLQQIAGAAPPPATTMEAGMQQAPVGGAPALGPGEQSGMAPSGADATGAGQPGGTPDASAGPQAGPAPGDQGAAPGQQGAASPAPTADQLSPQGDQTPPQPEKQGSVSDLERYLAAGSDFAKKHAPEAIGGAVGALGGAALPFALQGDEQQLAALQNRVANNEARRQELGWREELSHIKDKSMLDLAEFENKHPAVSHLAGAFAGMGAGAGAGKTIGAIQAARKLPTGGYGHV